MTDKDLSFWAYLRAFGCWAKRESQLFWNSVARHNMSDQNWEAVRVMAYFYGAVIPAIISLQLLSIYPMILSPLSWLIIHYYDWRAKKRRGGGC